MTDLAVRDFIFTAGKPSKKDRNASIGPLKQAAIVLGERGQVTPDDTAALIEALKPLGITQEQVTVAFAPLPPDVAERKRIGALPIGEQAKAIAERPAHAVVRVEGLGGMEPPVTHEAMMARLQEAGLASVERVTATRERIAEDMMPLSERVKRDGFMHTFKESFEQAPLKIIGAFYFVGDMLSLLVGGINSFGLIQSRGTGDMIFGGACASSSVLMLGWGDRSSGKSASQTLLGKMTGDFESSPLGQALGYRAEPATGSTAERADQYLTANASRITKYINAIAPVGMAKAAIEQRNPIKIAQTVFAGIGFPVSLMMPPEGIRFSDTGLGKSVENNALLSPLRGPLEGFYKFLQERPNSLIGLSVIHNILGFGTSAFDILRSGKNQVSLREEFTQTIYQPVVGFQTRQDGVIEAVRDARSWSELSTPELKNHLQILKDGWAVDAPGGGVRALNAEERDALARAVTHSYQRGNHDAPARMVLTLPSGAEVTCTALPPQDRMPASDLSRFENAVFDYQMFGRLRISALPYAAMVGAFFFGNALYGLSREPKERIHPDELFGLAARDWLNRLPEQGAPQEVLTHGAALLQAMGSWMAARPEIQFMRQQGIFGAVEADQLADLIAGKILETAEATAAYHGSGGRWQEWQSALAGLDRSTTEVARSPAADLSLSQLQQAPVPEIQAESSGLTVNDRGLIPGSGDLSVAASR